MTWNLYSNHKHMKIKSSFNEEEEKIYRSFENLTLVNVSQVMFVLLNVFKLYFLSKFQLFFKEKDNCM